VPASDPAAPVRRAADQQARPTIAELSPETPSDEFIMVSWPGLVAIVIVLLLLFFPIPSL
jgi:hypothetical protein